MTRQEEEQAFDPLTHCTSCSHVYDMNMELRNNVRAPHQVEQPHRLPVVCRGCQKSCCFACLVDSRDRGGDDDNLVPCPLCDDKEGHDMENLIIPQLLLCLLEERIRQTRQGSAAANAAHTRLHNGEDRPQDRAHHDHNVKQEESLVKAEEECSPSHAVAVSIKTDDEEEGTISTTQAKADRLNGAAQKRELRSRLKRSGLRDRSRSAKRLCQPQETYSRHPTRQAPSSRRPVRTPRPANSGWEPKYKIGSKVAKYFDVDGSFRLFRGEVTHVYEDERLYHITYEDNDEEDVSEGEDMEEMVALYTDHPSTPCSYVSSSSALPVLPVPHVTPVKQQDDDETSSDLSAGCPLVNQHDDEKTGGVAVRCTAGAQGEAPGVAYVKSEELSRNQLIKASEHMKNYGTKVLLGRLNLQGLAKLGGSAQDTFPKPRAGHPRLHDIHIGQMKVACYNDVWQAVSAPLHAGQETANVDCIPRDLAPGEEFAVFMRRSLTGFGPGVKTQGKLLGWEYCGNYECMEGEEMWAQASSFSPVSKKYQAKKILKSAASVSGYGREILDSWKARLTRELGSSPPQSTKPTLADRARNLGFRPDMSDEDLAHLIVELDELHVLHPIRFKRYDDEMYNYVKDGCTNRDANGNIVAKTWKDPATAQAWYDFLHQIVRH